MARASFLVVTPRNPRRPSGGGCPQIASSTLPPNASFRTGRLVGDGDGDVGRLVTNREG